MSIELLPTRNSMKLDMNLLAVTDPVVVMLAKLSAVEDVIEGCLPARAVSTCVMVYVVA